MYYVYVLYSKTSDKFYIGFTSDLKARVQKHQENGNHTTKRFKEIGLVYYEACLSEKDARSREKQLKTGFGRAYLRKRLAESIKQNNAAIV